MECGAKLRNKDAHCRKGAGWGTDHPGEGKCKLHGGATPIKTTGKYSRYNSRRLHDRLEHLRNDPDPLDLLPEVLLLRAMAGDFVERYEEYRDALLAWNDAELAEAAEEERKPRPQRLLDIADAHSLVESISRVAERLVKVKSSNAVTLEQVSSWFAEFGKVVAKHADPAAVARIERDWGSPLGGSGGGA